MNWRYSVRANDLPMPLHPIRALDHVIDEYRDYLRSEFRAKDPGLREALERELDRSFSWPRNRSFRRIGRSSRGAVGRICRSIRSWLE